MRYSITTMAFVGAAWVILLGAPAPLHAETNDTCLSCHGEKTEDLPFVDSEEFGASIHGKNLCISCHADAKRLPHPDKLAPVSCASCHRIEAGIYKDSDHGRALSKGISEAATCTSCHGKTHTLLSSRNHASPVNRKNIPDTCGSCHADTEKMSRFRLTEKEPIDSYLHSVHGQALEKGAVSAAVCSDCHGTHDLHAASNPASKVYRMNAPKTCGRCHENVREVFERSIHGKAIAAGIKESPVCTDCHGEHKIGAIKDPNSTVWVGAITKTCSECHESEKLLRKFGLPVDRLKTYQESYHGLAAMGGDLRVANCSSCHGWHDILPSYDTQSSINSKNLRYTCGKCHAGAEARHIEGSVHGAIGDGVAQSHFLIGWVRTFYFTLIPVLIGGMLLYNLADYLRKAFSTRQAAPHQRARPEARTAPPYRYDPRGAMASLQAEPGEEPVETVLRLTANERIQHALLVTTFIVLAYTGFALKYHDAWWAAPFAMAGGEAIRKTIHRWTALCLVLLGLYHLLYMLGTRRGRELLMVRYLPRWRDLLDPVATLAYNLGLKKAKPGHVYPCFIEKMEYFSLIWGSLVMAGTGSLLVFSDSTLKYFPLWVTDVATLIHFYEAVLACLAIGVWHFYWVIFDPDVYPMNWAWLTGRLRREESGEQQQTVPQYSTQPTVRDH